MSKIELTKKDQQKIYFCVMEIRAILENGLDEGHEVVNYATRYGFHYENDDDLRKEYKKIRKLELKLEGLWKIYKI